MFLEKKRMEDIQRRVPVGPDSGMTSLDLVSFGVSWDPSG